MLLAPAEQALRARQRSALQELEHTLVRMDASEADTTTLRESITVLDSLFLCCVLGEFNAGKSALLNALLGGSHCGEGVLPTTAAITLIKHPSVPFEPSHAQSEVEVLDIPRSWLRGLHLVDTPGTNSIEDAHTALTQVDNPDLTLTLTLIFTLTLTLTLALALSGLPAARGPRALRHERGAALLAVGAAAAARGGRLAQANAVRAQQGRPARRDAAAHGQRVRRGAGAPPTLT